jgi:hypothetical protein
MALILPSGPSWGYCSDNLAATPSITPGTAVTSGGSANTDGTAATLLSALAHDCEYLSISLLANSGSNTNRSALLDVLVDPAGGTSWSELISDLLCGYSGLVAVGSTPFGPSYQYDFPLWIPAGASIGAQVRCATASIAQQVVIRAFGGNQNPGSWACGQKVTTVGTMSAATSQGQAHTSGNTGAFSSWTSLGSTLASECLAWQTSAQGDGTNTMNSAAYTFEFGYGSTRIGPRRLHMTGTSEGVCAWPTGVAFNKIAAGTQLQVRGTCSGTAESIDVAAYVVS